MTAPQQFLTETRERFLRTILAKVPAPLIRELYLFQPIRQGGVESGVAVVAAYEETASGVGSTESGATDTRVVSVDEEYRDGTRVESCEIAPPAAVAGDQPPAALEHGSADAADSPVAPDSRLPTPDARYTVYTARYRHTLKGPDRGKWEASIVAEAEAPLLSIESVVRGVQRRAGDVEPPDHMTAAELRAALRLEPAPGGT